MLKGKKGWLIVVAAALVLIGANGQVISSDDSSATRSINPLLLEGDAERNPLKPPDTSSPRTTLKGFLESMHRSHRLLMAAHEENIKTPGPFTSSSVRLMGRRAEEFFERGVHFLDLSEVPEAIKREMGDVSALELKEILDRIALPPFDAVPDLQAIERGYEKNKTAAPFRWRVPDTAIVIARVEDGARKGEYLFSPRTVERLAEFYHKAKHLPYKSDAVVSEGFLDFYIRNAGRLLPPKWNQWLPAWTKRAYLGQTLWQWLAYAAALILICSSNITLYRRLLSRASELSPARRHWRRVFMALFAYGTLLFLYVFGGEINITGSVLFVSRRILVPVAWALMATGTFILGQAISESIIASPNIDPKGIQASYLRAVFGLFGFFASGAIIIYGLSRVGISLIPLLAGLGIGGLAVALAARPTIENIISGFMIFLDKPFRVGERIKILGQDGIVESIGLRSTKIRLLSGPQTSIPNKLVVDKEVQNMGRRQHIRRRFSITIPQETPPEKIVRAVEILKEILAVPQTPGSENGNGPGEPGSPVPGEGDAEKEPHPNEAVNRPKRPPRVYFNVLNPDSLSILVLYWYSPPKYWEYMSHAHWVNVQIIERFKAEGIDLYMPTQRMHLTDDDKRSPVIDQRWLSKEDELN